MTGASAGVGRATALAFARRAARIALLARGEDGLEATAREVRALGGEALTIPTDVADADQIERAAARVERELGDIDVWINNAMTSIFAEAVQVCPADFRRVTEVTYLGAVYGTLAALRRMIPRDRGKIVQVGSALAYRGIPLQSAYCGAKHAMHGFTESVRCELMHAKSAVKITMVQMPALNTPQFRWVKSYLPKKSQPVPPIFQPEVAAAGIVWATDHDRRELFVGSSTLEAIWGNKIAPWYADRYLAKHGFADQQIDEPEDPDRPDNLWSPVPGDHGAHGVFDARAKEGSGYLWLTTHRGLFALGAAAVAAVGVADLAVRALTAFAGG